MGPSEGRPVWKCCTAYHYAEDRGERTEVARGRRAWTGDDRGTAPNGLERKKGQDGGLALVVPVRFVYVTMGGKTITEKRKRTSLTSLQAVSAAVEVDRPGYAFFPLSHLLSLSLTDAVVDFLAQKAFLDGHEISSEEDHRRLRNCVRYALLKYLLEHEQQGASLKKLQTAVDYQTAKSEDMADKDLRSRVANLREEWDRNESVALQRRRQLEGIASDAGRSLDDRRRELEAWLSRMEARLDRQAAAGPPHSLEALEAQIREQRLLNAELTKWKAAVDSVTRLAHKVASEPRSNSVGAPLQEDPARLMAAVEGINQRFADLTVSVQNRGQALQSALGSMHQLEKALDRFLGWLAEAEATLDVLETEADRYGPRDDVHRSCSFQDRIRSGRYSGVSLRRAYRDDAFVGVPTASFLQELSAPCARLSCVARVCCGGAVIPECDFTNRPSPPSAGFGRHLDTVGAVIKLLSRCLRKTLRRLQARPRSAPVSPSRLSRGTKGAAAYARTPGDDGLERGGVTASETIFSPQTSSRRSSARREEADIERETDIGISFRGSLPQNLPTLRARACPASLSDLVSFLLSAFRCAFSLELFRVSVRASRAAREACSVAESSLGVRV
ncbi:hypothetical protein MRX96_007875 [Rhipicephalus microplus]